MKRQYENILWQMFEAIITGAEVGGFLLIALAFWHGDDYLLWGGVGIFMMSLFGMLLLDSKQRAALKAQQGE